MISEAYFLSLMFLLAEIGFLFWAVAITGESKLDSAESLCPLFLISF